MDILGVTGIIGTISFSLSGAAVALEEEYDIFGMFILGFVTAFGGGIIRNLMLGVSMELFWSQTYLFVLSGVVILILSVFPSILSAPFFLENLYDAIGLAAFSIQGTLLAISVSDHLSAAIISAVLTGSGGGVIRDVLANRKPIVLRTEIYSTWSVIIAILIYLNRGLSRVFLIPIILISVVLRLVSIKYKWHLPRTK